MSSISSDTFSSTKIAPDIVGAKLLLQTNKQGLVYKFVFRRHLNKLRWLVLSAVFSMLIILPLLHLYQTHLKSNTYEILSDSEKVLFDGMSVLTSVVPTPEIIFDNFSGTTWTGTLFGYELSDPLAVVTNAMSRISSTDGFDFKWNWNWIFLTTALIPIFLSMVLGRFFCGWICPATFIYELNDNLGTWLQKIGFPPGQHTFNKKLKYVILAAVVLLTIPIGATLVSSFYPPAVLGRELYFVIAMGGFGVGAMIFIATLMFDLLIARRGICRYVCPGGALYSLLGRYRLIRISRDVSQCNDCGKCNTACQMGLDPMHDSFGQECNNCSACIAICPTDSLNFNATIKDTPIQGPGHLGVNFYKTKINQSTI